MGSRVRKQAQQAQATSDQSDAAQAFAFAQALVTLADSNPQLKAALAQFATPVAVAAAVVKQPKPKTPREVAYEVAQKRGYGLAKNGEVTVTADSLTAAARVMRSGGVEIVPAPQTETYTRRKIVGTVVFRVDDRTVAFHELYKLDGDNVA